MEDTDSLAALEQRIADAINTGDIPLADQLRQTWTRQHLRQKVTARA
jgi:hypothetical protein